MKTKVWRLFFIVTGLCFLSFPIQAEAKTKTVMISWSAVTTCTDGSTCQIAGYRIYWGRTHDLAANKTGTMVERGSYTSACIQVDDSYPVYYLGVVAYDTSGVESSSNIAYLLFGNIAGTYNDGTPYTSARVDGFDLTTLGLYFGQSVSHPTYDCSGTFVIQLPTDAQKCDLNKDGRVDGLDLIELGLRFGNAAYP